jgi:hypothetical protein
LALSIFNKITINSEELFMGVYVCRSQDSAESQQFEERLSLQGMRASFGVNIRFQVIEGLSWCPKKQLVRDEQHLIKAVDSRVVGTISFGGS